MSRRRPKWFERLYSVFKNVFEAGRVEKLVTPMVEDVDIGTIDAQGGPGWELTEAAAGQVLQGLRLASSPEETSQRTFFLELNQSFGLCNPSLGSPSLV